MPKKSKKSSPNLLAPRYWPSWMGLGSIYTVTLLPYAWQLAIGRWVGRLWMYLSISRTEITDTNLGLCLPELDDAARRKLRIRAFEAFGMATMETAFAWWGSDKRLEPLSHVEGLEYLDAALSRGKGVILLTAHMASPDFSARMLSLHTPVGGLYRRHRNPVMEYVLQRHRKRHFPRILERRDIRGLMRCLQANLSVWYAPDQDLGRRHSVYVPFLGIRAATITATSRLAKMSGAQVVPYFPYRLEAARGYRIVIYPPLEDFPSDDVERDTARVNEIIGQAVRKEPAQYLWNHRRFKTQPRGVSGFYKDRKKK